MLKTIAFENVGLFQERNVITCCSGEQSGGLAIFVGKNGSGKSMALECIRRCLADNMQHSESTIPDEDKKSYIISVYEVHSQYINEVKNLLQKENLPNGSGKLSTTTCDCICGKLTGSQISFKFLYLEPIGLLTCKMDKHDKCFIGTPNDEDLSLFRLLIYGSVDASEEEKVNTACDSFKVRMEGFVKSSEIPIEKFHEIYQKINFGLKGAVRFLYPHRGIGPMHSSSSHKMENKDTNFYSESDDETFKRLFSEVMSDGNKRYAYECFKKQIVPNSPYNFVFKSKRSKVFVIDQGVGRPGQVPLLKSPEGMYEAELVCLFLVTDGRPATICLDEPNRCMHPSMIDNLRNAILKAIRNKKISIVLSTHSSNFITAETWSQCYHFRRCVEPRNIILETEDIENLRWMVTLSKEKPGLVSHQEQCSIEEDKEIDDIFQATIGSVNFECKRLSNFVSEMKTLRFLTLANIREILFAEKVFAVEGQRDYIFMLELLRQLFPSSCNITAVHMDGKRNATHLIKLLKHVTDYAILFDRDVVDTHESYKHCPRLQTLVSPGVSSNLPRTDIQSIYKVSSGIKIFLNSLQKNTDQEIYISSKINNNRLKEYVKLDSIIDCLKKLIGTCGKSTKFETDLAKIHKVIKNIISEKCEIFLNRDEIDKLLLCEEWCAKSFNLDLPCEGYKILQKIPIANVFIWKHGGLEDAVNNCFKENIEIRDRKPLIVRAAKQEERFYDHDDGEPKTLLISGLMWFLEKKSENADFPCIDLKEVTQIVKGVIEHPSQNMKAFFKFLKIFAHQ